MNDPYYASYLREELARRVARNPRYSMRAFSAALGIDPSSLSRILAGKQVLAVKLGARLAAQLDLTLEERAKFLYSAVDERRRREIAWVKEALAAQESLTVSTR